MKSEMMKKAGKYKPSIIGIVFLAIALCLMYFPNDKQQPATNILTDSSSINRICELATLKNYYHNVIVYVKEPDGGDKFFNDVLIWPFGGYVRKGYKQFWIEYSGIVEMGIDASQIQINAPNSEGVVNVYVPDAEVFNVYPDENSFSDPITELGVLTGISAKEKLEAFSRAQETMSEEANEDKAQLFRAKNNAKSLLKEYIINSLGTKYTINWIDNPL